MCFHDNAIDPNYFDDFADYASAHTVTGWFWTGWTGPDTFMETSGSDASVLTCAAERHHPNQNYDQTATRVLKTMQSSEYLYDDNGDSISLKSKYDLSYADLLHNGCIAATIWSAGLDASAVLAYHPFSYGRKDACHIKVVSFMGHTATVPLCGPSNLLPGVLFTAEEADDWFTSRGMNREQWLSLFWSHTLMDNTAHKCPVRHLPCTHSPTNVECCDYDVPADSCDIDFNGDGFACANDWGDDKTDYILEDGAVLDYFGYFLTRGEHQPTDISEITDPEDASCNWKFKSDVETEPDIEHDWPLTRFDCSISKDVIENDTMDATAKAELLDVIDEFKDHDKERMADYLLCALGMMSTGDPKVSAGGACKRFEDEDPDFTTDYHKFGAAM